MSGRILAVAGALLLAACGQSTTPADTSIAPPASPAEPAAPAVDAALLAAPVSDFAAIEPSEIAITGAATLDEALAPLTMDTHAESGSLQVSVQENGDNAIADIVRMGLADDSVAAAHLRLEFRREPDGWYPTNAYRRFQCARGDLAGQWSVTPCP
jgi:hypothetical protein